MSADEAAIELEAARVAIVALFGAVPSYETIDANRVRIAPDAAVLPLDAAARLLASMPKPLVCLGENVGGVLNVSCELLVERMQYEQERFEKTHGLDGEDDGLFTELGARDGADDGQLIAAFGGAKAEVVSLAGAMRWYRDYEIEHANWKADNADNPLANSDPEYAESRRRGAKGILQFSSPSTQVPSYDGSIFSYPLPADASPQERRNLEKSFVETAKSLLFELDEEEELETVERGMVARGEIPADSLSGRGRDPAQHMQRLLASQMTHFFEGRAMPPEVAAFVDACRRK